MTLDEARENIGGLVRFEANRHLYEYGLISSVSAHYCVYGKDGPDDLDVAGGMVMGPCKCVTPAHVFVRYTLGDTAAATRPEDLTLIVRPVR